MSISLTSPKQVTLLPGKAVIASGGSANCTIVSKCSSAIAKTAERKIAKRICELAKTDTMSGGITVTLETAAPDQDIRNADQGYRLTISENDVRLTGFGERGLLYAAVTFCQLLEENNGVVSVACARILDWPDMEKRGHFVESRYGTDLMTLDDWKAVVDDLVEKKQNTLTVSLYGCWGIQYDGAVCEYVFFSLDKYPKLKTSVHTRYYSAVQKCWIDKVEDTPMADDDCFGKLCAYAAENGVQIVPLINTYGHNTLIPRMYPQVSAKFSDGTPTHNGYCTAEEKTYEMLFDITDHIIDRYLLPYGFDAFDIGMDEIDDGCGVIGIDPDDPFSARPAFCECEKCRGIPNSKKFIDHAVKLALHLKEKGMREVYIYNDMFFRKFDAKKDPYPTIFAGSDVVFDNYIPIFRAALEENGLLDTVIMNWWKYTDVAERFSFTPSDIAASGITSVVKPMNGYYHWNVLRPSVRNSTIMAHYVPEIPDCRGMLSYSSWDRIFDRTNSVQAMLGWNIADAPTAEDATMRYCRFLFPTDAEQAFRAFTLLDKCDEESFIKDENGRKLLDSRTMIEREMAYYRFSYISKDFCYPRNFPSEGLGYILASREEHEKLIREVSAAATEAAKIFRSLAGTSGGELAERYALEADNFALLCADYTALMRMYDLSASPLDDAAVSEITELAAERKASRIAYIAEAERIQQPYLHSSHLRNQSIFMQLFDDIAAYVNSAPANELHLDMSDLNSIASERSLWMR